MIEDFFDWVIEDVLSDLYFIAEYWWAYAILIGIIIILLIIQRKQ